jgi:hypothetical protein
MTDARRARTLAILARLNRRDAEEAARELAGLRSEEARLRQDRDNLLHSMETDRTLPDADGAPYRAAWLQALSAETQRLSSEAVRLRPRIDAAATRVSDAFRETKTVETLQDRLADTDRRNVEARRAQDVEPFLLRMPR